MKLNEALKRHWLLLSGAALLLLVAVGVTVAALTGMFSAPNDEASAPPRATAEVTPEPEPSESEPAPEPEVSIDTTEVMAYSPVWDPPDDGENFWQIVDPQNGYPEDGGTDYVLAHSCLPIGCAGDQLHALEAGDDFTYRGEKFVVEQKLEITKDQIGDQDIWTHDPDRLIIITCIIDPETGESHENNIIDATRAG